MPEPASVTTGCGPRRSRVGRADLLYVRQRQGQAFLLRSAGLLGFRAPEKRTEVEAESGDKLQVQISSPGAQPAQVLAGDESPKYGKQRFYRLLEREQILDEKRVTEPPARLLKTAPFTRPASEPI
ncbi:MAG: hypothetical protein GY945_14055, partial [Rhodobacteraceae bacterium]|nr:hypothetical protein [Paracoccaceae bacterium]